MSKPDVNNHKKSNKKEKPSFEHIEGLLQSAPFDAQEARPGFQQGLEQKLLERRAKRKSAMKKGFSFNWAMFARPQAYVPALSFLVIAAILMLTYYPQGPASISQLANMSNLNFKDLIIQPAYAMDNFEVEATSGDNFGVTKDTAFLIKSKDVVDPDALKQNIKLAPQKDFRFEQIDEKTFKVTPSGQLDGATVYNLTIDSEYVDDENVTVERDYSWAFQVQDSFRVTHTLPGDKTTSVQIRSGVEITFSHPNVDLESFKNSFTIDPSVKGKFEVHNKTLVFVPEEEMAYGTIYTVRLADSLTMNWEPVKMGKELSFQFETQLQSQWEYRRSAYFSEMMYEFASKDTPAFRMYASKPGSETISAKVYAFHSVDQFLSAITDFGDKPRWSAYWYQYRYANEKYDSSKLSIVGEYDLEFIQNGASGSFPILQLPNELPKGFYMIETEWGGSQSYAYFQVNDLSTFYSVSTDGENSKILAWVNDLQTKQPAERVSVSVHGENVAGVTDNDGISLLNLPKQSGDKAVNLRNYILMVNRGSETSLLPFVNGNSAHTWGSYGNNFFWNYLYLDKAKYLPTDRIQFWTYLSKRSNVAVATPKTLEVQLRRGYNLRRDSTNVIQTKTISLDSHGSYEGHIDVKDLEPGYYYLYVLLDGEQISSRGVQIQNYVKPAFKAELELDKGVYFVGDTAKATVKASFFEGTPVPGMTFEIGSSDRSYYSSQSYSKGRVKFPATNEQGETQVDQNIVVPPCSKNFDFSDQPLSYSSYYCYPFSSQWFTAQNVNAELTEISVSKRAHVIRSLVFPEADVTSEQQGTAALRVEAWKIDPKAVADKDYVSSYWLDKDLVSGHETGLKLKYRLVEHWSESKKTGTYYDYINKVSRDRYSYTPRHKVYEEKEGYINESGVFEDKTLVIPQNGHRYYIELLLQDKQGNVFSKRLYVPYSSSGRDSKWYEPWKLDNLNLQIDGGKRVYESSSPEFRIGDQVLAHMVNSGEQRLPDLNRRGYLYYTMQAGYMSHKVSNTATYQFLFGEKHIPNVYLQGIHFDGRRYHIASQGFMNSGTAINYDETQRELNIDIQADKSEYKPGDTARLRVAVVDENGNPKQSTVNINLMDEALYTIARQHINTLGNIYKPLPSGERIYYGSHKAATEAFMGAEGGCFLPGTQISMADGSKKNIEQIQVGDMIETFANESRQKKVSARVADVFVHDGQFEYLVVNNTLRVTPIHVVFLNGTWQMAENIKVGDTMVGEDGQMIEITSVEYKSAETKVYNFHVETYHTYIADGYYVHNEKGGGEGEVRTDFKDIASFKTVRTNSEGVATIDVELPDNITQWRVIVQAISDDKYAGHNSTGINATLPFFVDTVYADQFLPTDRPDFQFRGYGKALNFGSTVDYTFSAPSLGLEKSLAAPAYTTAYVGAQSDLPLGKHAITVRGSSEGYKDGIQKEVEVIRSRVESEKISTYTIDENTSLDRPDTDQKVQISFVNKNLTAAYHELYDLTRARGHRVDQRVVSKKASQILEEVFDRSSWYARYADEDLSKYQHGNGGMLLLPYDSPRVSLTARVANAGLDEFNQAKMVSYLEEVLLSKEQTRDEVIWALYGLSALDQPVLLDIKNFAQLPGLTLLEKELIALSAYNLGDKEYARKLYFEILEQYGQQSGDVARVVEQNAGDPPEQIRHTTYAALLGALIEDDTHHKLWLYASDRGAWFGAEKIRGADDVYYLEGIRYVEQLLRKARPTESSLVINLDNKQDTVEVKAAYGASRVFEADQLPNISFSDVQGDITAQVRYISKSQDVATSPYVKLRREYRVNGEVTTQFREDDIVEVRISADIDSSLRSGLYTVTDLLPSGLIPSQGRLETRPGGTSDRYIYPYMVDKQQIQFRTYSSKKYSGKVKSYVYYARVSTPGTYTAEPAIIQSVNNPEHTASTQSQTITVLPRN